MGSINKVMAVPRHALGFTRVRAGFGMATISILALVLGACGGDEPAPTTAPASQVAAGGAPPAPAVTPAATPAATPVAAVPALPVDQLLRSASQAVSDERLITPPGNNAVEFYLAVMDQEPNNVQATQALVDIFPLVAGVAEREVAQKHIEEADRIVALLDKASPGSYTVTTIRAKLDAARATAQREQDAQLAAQQAALRASQQAAETPTPTPEPVAAVPAPSPTTTAPRPATTPAATPAPTPQPVAAVPAPAPPSGETREARPVRQVPPEYPIDAIRKRQTGWVELEFTVSADGRVSNVQVARANPNRVFDKEAVRAMQQWTFEPALKDGQPIESRLRRRIEFQR